MNFTQAEYRSLILQEFRVEYQHLATQPDIDEVFLEQVAYSIAESSERTYDTIEDDIKRLERMAWAWIKVVHDEKNEQQPEVQPQKRSL